MRALFAVGLLVLLGVLRPSPVRADDPPPGDTPASSAPSGDVYDPADTNQDGTVSRREARRYRRKMRRRAGANGSAPADGEGGDDGSAAATSASIAAGGAGALGKAAGAAGAMSAALPSAEAGAMPGGGANAGERSMRSAGGGSPAGGSGAAGGSVQAGGAGTPGYVPPSAAAAADLLNAARGGYGPAFAKAGLKLSPDGRSIVRLDGSAASASDLASLRQAMSGMPRALERRPDFFGVISPEHYSEVKQGYHQHPELGDSVYKHVGTTPDDRDMVHTQSCSKVSGDCNEAATKESYKKGEFVAPEDLEKMWKSLEEAGDDEPSASKEPEAEKGPEATAVAAPDAPDAAGAQGGLKIPVGAPAAAAVKAAADAVAPGPGEVLAVAATAGRWLAAVAAPLVDPKRPASARGLAWAALAGALAAVVFLFASRRDP